MSLTVVSHVYLLPPVTFELLFYDSDTFDPSPSYPKFKPYAQDIYTMWKQNFTWPKTKRVKFVWGVVIKNENKHKLN